MAKSKSPLEMPPSLGGTIIKKVKNIEYLVTDEITALSCGDDVYPVVNGKVAIPAGATWHYPLIEAGLLIQVGDEA